MRDVIRKRAVIDGIVQGVFFRAATRDAAEEFGVAGWVRNLPTGQVEAVFEGERDGVKKAIEWCGHGPPRAVVQHVEIVDETPEGLSGFYVR